MLISSPNLTKIAPQIWESGSTKLSPEKGRREKVLNLPTRAATSHQNSKSISEVGTLRWTWNPDTDIFPTFPLIFTGREKCGLSVQLKSSFEMRKHLKSKISNDWPPLQINVGLSAQFWEIGGTKLPSPENRTVKIEWIINNSGAYWPNVLKCPGHVWCCSANSLLRRTILSFGATPKITQSWIVGFCWNLVSRWVMGPWGTRSDWSHLYQPWNQC